MKVPNRRPDLTRGSTPETGTFLETGKTINTYCHLQGGWNGRYRWRLSRNNRYRFSGRQHRYAIRPEGGKTSGLYGSDLGPRTGVLTLRSSCTPREHDLRWYAGRVSQYAPDQQATYH